MRNSYMRNPSVVIESPGDSYDIAAIINMYLDAYVRGDAERRLTPKNLKGVLDDLEQLTTQIEKAIANGEIDNVRFPGWVPLPELFELTFAVPVAVFDYYVEKSGGDEQKAQILLELARWRLRLAAYQDRVSDAIKIDAQGRALVGKSVASPLFLGWFFEPLPGGRNAYPQNFDLLKQARADVLTPYMIANQIGVLREHKIEIFEEFKKDLTDPDRIRDSLFDNKYIRYAAYGVGAIAAFQLASLVRGK